MNIRLTQVSEDKSRMEHDYNAALTSLREQLKHRDELIDELQNQLIDV